ncbi:hypothetical protein [Butyrivibrio sp. INlla14]|uniref:hypothetical protein n=1 Tax=Butyrivibrio sp. INlla14 TaxID=1520808 RepID=UPI00087740AF|nr:hypothetical protein [Butyrivibrio sp. INlla14]SCY63044.1 hypothetical protein SAMN02910371_03111 [Butyrivibrio sp. INlla14]
MADILNLKAGVRVALGTHLYEGYQKDTNYITANVGVDKIEEVLQHFIAIHDEPLFFILELPAKADDETEVAPGVVKTLHNDVYYIDGCSQEEALTILIRVGKLLYNDGMSSFGFGGHQSHDEIMFGKYNVLTIYSETIEEYEDFFEPHEIEETDHLITAWDTFTADNPGVSEKYTMDGKTVYDIPKLFEEWGMYLAEQREEN